MSYQYQKAVQKKEAHELKKKALQPCEKFCKIAGKKVIVLIEYPDYKGAHFKGQEGTLYCEDIIPCYRKNIECKYSGISPLYPDPFLDEIEPKENL